VEPPAHVPAGHVVDFDYLRPQGLEEQNIYHALKPLHSCPDIFWTCRNGGHWVVTRSEDVRWVRNEHTIFSHEEFGIPRGSMNVPMPPVTVDPPYHARYRPSMRVQWRPG
jgi:cytochrome P450